MDQVKLYGPDQDIKPGDVYRILSEDNRGAEYSKAVVSTTGRFPPVVRKGVESYGERVTLRDADVLREVFEQVLKD